MYFPHEFRSSESEDVVNKINEKAVFEFFRDYDICPTLITKGVAYKLYLQAYDNPMPVYYSSGQEVLGAQNVQNSPKVIGRFFTYFKFLDLIAKCAKTAYMDTESVSNGNLIEAEMLCLMLERMELSKGFHNFEKKTAKPHTSKITLLPSR